jgi:hypothetical protein
MDFGFGTAEHLNIDLDFDSAVSEEAKPFLDPVCCIELFVLLPFLTLSTASLLSEVPATPPVVPFGEIHAVRRLVDLLYDIPALYPSP